MNDLKIWEYSDIFNPVTDLNENFATVKGAIESLESGAVTDEQDISDLKTKVGSDALVTTAQTLSGAVNELDDDLNHASTGVIARLTAAENSIDTLETQAGNATLVTTAQTLSGATNELKGRIDVVDSMFLFGTISVATDGIKTNGQLLSELSGLINTKLANEPNSRIELAQLVVPEVSTFMPFYNVVADTSLNYVNMKAINVSPTFVEFYNLSIRESNPACEVVKIDSTGTFTHTDLSQNVPASGQNLSLRYYYRKKEGE